MSQTSIAKYVALAGLLFCTACVSGSPRTPAAASQNPNWPIVEGMSREAASVGRLFSPLAKRFGNFEYSYASPTAGGRAYLFEYNLSGEQLGDWSRLVTIQFVPVDPAPGQAEALLQKLKRAPDLQANVILRESYPGGNGGSYFRHYTIGGGLLHEEGLSMTWVVAQGAVATFQLMNRGEKYTPEEIGRFRSMAATISGPAVP